MTKEMVLKQLCNLIIKEKFGDLLLLMKVKLLPQEMITKFLSGTLMNVVRLELV